MKVTPIAVTALLMQQPESIKGTQFHNERFMNPFANQVSGDIDVLHEFAGRACYQSWEMPNPKTATNDGYMQNIIEQGHFSVMEHGSITFYVEGVSRSLTHELIRHRHLSYSELSQRYVNMEDVEFVTPPAMRDASNVVDVEFFDGPFQAQIGYMEIVDLLKEQGITGKKAREAARAVMPNATETKIVVTGNLRAWRDMLQKRWHVAADAEIREFAGEVLKHLREYATASVADIPEEPYQ